MPNCTREICKNGCMIPQNCPEDRDESTAANQQPAAVGLAAPCSAIGGEFYSGVEWLAAWLVDHAEGETVTEELARQWAIEAWKEHVRRPRAHPGAGCGPTRCCRKAGGREVSATNQQPAAEVAEVFSDL